MTTSRLLTAELAEKLRTNARISGEDHVPVLKLFNPAGDGTWLATELAEDNDTLFGLSDLGLGCPELGTFSLSELEAIRLPFGLCIERDHFFTTEYGLSAWAEAARQSGAITTAENILGAATRANRADE